MAWLSYKDPPDDPEASFQYVALASDSSQDYWEIGSGPDCYLRLSDSERVDLKHAVIRKRDGEFFISDQKSTNKTLVNAKLLEPYESEKLFPGTVVSIAKYEIRFEEEVSSAPGKRKRRVGTRRGGAMPSRLSEWWEWGSDVTEKNLDKALSTLEICGTTREAFEDKSLQSTIKEWFEIYYENKKWAPARQYLPVALPYLADLGVFLWCSPPPLRDPSSCGQYGEFIAKYQSQHLRALQNYIWELRFVREQLQKARDLASLNRVVHRFIWDLFGFVSDTWFLYDSKKLVSALALGPRDYPIGVDRLISRMKESTIGREEKSVLSNFIRNVKADRRFNDVQEFVGAIKAWEKSKCKGDPPILLHVEDALLFLEQMSKALSELARFQKAIPRLEKFFLGALCCNERSYDNCNKQLIQACLRSRDLVERDYIPHTTYLDLSWPEVLSRNLGESHDIDRIRSSTELRKIPEAIPQDLLYLAADSEKGPRLFAHKVLNEGLLIWERKDQMRESIRQRYLVCIVSDIGKAAEQSASLRNDYFKRANRSGNRGSLIDGIKKGVSSDTHGRRLIFDMLRDMAGHVDLPDVDVDINVFLEPVASDEKQRLTWHMTLEELKLEMKGDLYNSMVEIERRAPSYFFLDTPGEGKSRVGHLQFIENVFSDGCYDFTLFVFLGPRKTVCSRLMPNEVARMGIDAGTRCMIMAVHLDCWADWVEVAVSCGFEESAFGMEFRILNDDDFRYSIIEALMGRLKDRTERSEQESLSIIFPEKRGRHGSRA